MSPVTLPMLRLEPEPRRLLLTGLDSIDAAKRLAGIPGARALVGGVWTFPATPATAARIRRKLDDHPGWGLDAGVCELLQGHDHADAPELRELRSADREVPPISSSSSLPAWRHQRAAFHFARELPAALLYMGMGTGKTRVALDLLNANEARASVVLCPLAVVPAWKAQAEIHYPELEVVTLDAGSVPQKRKRAEQAIARAEANRRPVLLVVNYESAWRRPFSWLLAGRVWDYVIYDEIHRIKSPGGAASKFAASLVANSRRRLGLSGTPLAHSPTDAYGVFRALDPGLFGTNFANFRARYCIMGGFENREVRGYVNVEEFSRLFWRITFEATREVLELPPAVHVERTFVLPANAARVYRELREEFVAELGAGRVTAANALPRLLRLQQITSGFVPVELGGEPGASVEELHDEKRELLEDLLADLPPEEPVVVFCRFVRDLDAVHRAARADRRVCAELSGRRRELSLFQNGGATVLAVQIQSGAEGIDLTRARYAVFYSIGFSLAQYEQALARTHRPGQTRETFFVHLIAEGTVDRRLYRSLRARRDAIDDVLAGRGEDL